MLGVRNKRLGQTVYEKIRSSLLEGTVPVGGRMPTETDLSRLYNVSRPVVREALARLRAEGTIESRRGSGTFVRDLPTEVEKDTGFVPVKTLKDINHCFDFRISLEGEAAFHAALNRQEDDLSAIGEAMDRFAASTQAFQDGDTDDFALHMAIAEASKIFFFPSTISSMRRHVMVGMKLAGQLSGFEPAERLRLVRDEHRNIFEAIRDGDADRARADMRRHIDASRRRLFRGTD